MATHRVPLTADDLVRLPVPEPASGWEFVDGRPVAVMPASPVQGELTVEVAYRLKHHVTLTGLTGKVWSDVGFVLGLPHDPERMRAPDVAYIARERTLDTDQERFFRGVPDLAVEIDLNSGKKPGGQQRVLDYLEAGVRLVWVIDPYSRTAIAYHPDGSARLVRHDGALDGEDVVPGFRLALPDLFS